MVSRRDFLKTSLAGTAAAATTSLLPGEALAQAAPPHSVVDAAGVPVLNPAFQPKFVTPVPNAAAATFTYANAGAANTYVIGVEQTTHITGLVAANRTTPLTTPVWGYAGYGANSATAVTPRPSPGAPCSPVANRRAWRERRFR